MAAHWERGEDDLHPDFVSNSSGMVASHSRGVSRKATHRSPISGAGDCLPCLSELPRVASGCRVSRAPCEVCRRKLWRTVLQHPGGLRELRPCPVWRGRCGGIGGLRQSMLRSGWMRLKLKLVSVQVVEMVAGLSCRLPWWWVFARLLRGKGKLGRNEESVKGRKRELRSLLPEEMV